jgi:hypothetical protein
MRFLALLATCSSLLAVHGLCPSTSPLVHLEGDLRMIARQLRGSVFIKNDCEFEVRLGVCPVSFRFRRTRCRRSAGSK